MSSGELETTHSEPNSPLDDAEPSDDNTSDTNAGNDWNFTIQSMFPGFPEKYSEDAQQVFNQTMELILDVVNSQEFEDLFLVLCREVAESYHFTWKKDTARSDWDDWCHGNHRVVARFLKLQVHGKVLSNEFSRFSSQTQSIELDTSFLEQDPVEPNQQEVLRIKVLLLIKALHAIAHSLTELILIYINHLYRDKPHKKRKRLPKKFLPKARGDCGKSLEKLITGQNLLFNYEPLAEDVDTVSRIVVISPSRRFGYRIPQEVIEGVIATPEKCCSMLRSALEDAANPEEIPDQIFDQFVFKYGKPRERDQ